jgi:CxxC-x17-CxxC domain-containing protein
MTKVTCDSCKEKCEVPFKPTSNKPIYCENCFKKDSSPRSSSRSGPRASSNSNDLSKEIKKINKKLDIILKALKLE